MLIERTGNVLDIDEGIIIHGCNSLGVMGSGIASQIKTRFPQAYEIYKQAHLDGKLFMGSFTLVAVNDDPLKIIVNAVTQKNVGHGKQVSYDAIESCFLGVNKLMKDLGLKIPLCFPMIGAGLGGGNWRIIAEIIDSSVSNDFEKILYLL